MFGRIALLARSATGIGRTEPWTKPLRSAYYPDRSANQYSSGTCRSADVTASAGFLCRGDVDERRTPAPGSNGVYGQPHQRLPAQGLAD
jgi:hypothetical protein